MRHELVPVPMTPLSWDAYELRCWLDAYRLRGLPFRAIPDEFKAAIYDVIVSDAGVARKL